MLKKEDGNINDDYYREIMTDAANDVASVVYPGNSHVPEALGNYFYQAKSPYCMAIEAIRLTTQILARRYPSSKVFVAPWEEGDHGLKGYVSWLFISGEDDNIKFRITYDPDKINDLCKENVFLADKHLSKIVLHECGHGVRHFNKYRVRINPHNPNPEMDSRDELEAWFYAFVVWGILVGDYSFNIRKTIKSDGTLETDLGYIYT